MKRILISILAVLIALIGLPSCTTKKPEEKIELISKEDFILYFENNETELKIEDFEGIDIEQFIDLMQISSDNITYKLTKVRLKYYIDNKERLERDSKIFASEIHKVNSTEKEYKLFINEYFNALGYDYEYLSTYNNLNNYRVTTQNDTYFLKIGATKDLDKFTINKENYTRYYEIYFQGDPGYKSYFSYNASYKFFLVASDPNNKYDIEYELSLLFRKTK